MKTRARLVAAMVVWFCALTIAFMFAEAPEAMAQEKPEVKEYLDLGVKLYAQGMYRDALAQFNRVLVIEPENKIAQKYIEECNEYLKPSVVEEVTVEYPEKVAPPPTPVGPSAEEVRRVAVEKYLGFGQEYYDKEQYGKAVEEWERVLLIDPTNERAIQSIREATRRSLTKKRQDIQQDLEIQRQDNALQIEKKLFRPEGSSVDGIKPFRIALPPVEKKEVRLVVTKMKTILDRLNTTVGVDFAEGTDLRDVLNFLSDFVGVNIVLDERVMLPPAPPPVAPGTPGAAMYGAPGGGYPGYGAGPSGYSPGARGRAGARRPGASYGIGQGLGTTFGGGLAGAGTGQIVPNVASEVRRVYLKDIPLRDALKAMLSQMGLSYKVQPEFIWVSRPDVLRRESFEPLETRYYLLQNAGGESLPKVAMITYGGMMGGMGGMGGGGGYGGGMGGGLGGGGFGGGGLGGGGFGGGGGGLGGGGFGGGGGGLGGGGFGGGGLGGGGFGGGGRGGGGFGGGGLGGGGFGGGGRGGGGFGGGGMGGRGGGGMGGASFSNIMQLFAPVNHFLVGEVEPVIGLTGQLGGLGTGATTGATGGRRGGFGGGGMGGFGGGGLGGGGLGGGGIGGGGLGGAGGGLGAGAGAVAPGNIEIILILRSIIPDIIEPYTGRVLSYIDFSPTTNMLIIHNTASHFELIEEMIEHLDLTPRQVAIEAKFLTVTASDLQKVGVSWGGQIGDVDRRPRRLVDSEGNEIDATYPAVVGFDQTTTPATPVTADIPYYLNPDGSSKLNQTFTSGVMNLADALVSGIGAGNFSVTALLTKNEDGDFIQATIEFLSKLEHSELLSAPKVVALNRKPAMFADVSTEYFDAFRQTQLLGGGVYFGGAQSWGTTETVIPMMWVFGITLSTTAQIGKGDQIRLWLNPQVIDKTGEKTFTSTTATQDFTFDSTMTLPTTDVKAVWSNVIVHDGDTVVLGGMVEDHQQQITEKLPYLSDLPLIGRLFKGEGESSRQRNLLIFVTPTIIDTTGAKFFARD